MGAQFSKGENLGWDYDRGKKIANKQSVWFGI